MTISDRYLPITPLVEDFNSDAVLPYGCTVEAVYVAMLEFVRFLTLINQQLHVNQIEPFECLLMPANFSSIVGEFTSSAIPRYCTTLTRNRYHNGHPDLIPVGEYVNDAVQYASEGIEVKASRYPRGWQGHNPEAVWLMIFVFDASRMTDEAKGIASKPFSFSQVLCARLEKEDWQYAGRSETSRRTITAAVNARGYRKLAVNWLYRRRG